MNNFRRVCIVAAGRSPMCKYKGQYLGLSAIDLAASTLEGTLSKYSIDPSSISELILGNVYSGNLGQSPPKQVALKAGLSDRTVCSLVNKVCSSGMLAISSAAMTIAQGYSEVIAAGGVEMMTNAPYYQERQDKSQVHDGLIKDGLWDAKYNLHMVDCGEILAEEFNVPRVKIDSAAAESFQRASSAWEKGKFNQEIIPIFNPHSQELVEKDTLKGKNLNFASLRPIFKKNDGKLTVGNVTPLTDGAAMVVLCSEEKAREMGWNVLAEIVSFAHFEQNNIKFTSSPSEALKLAAQRAQIDLKEIDFFEINETFSVVAIVNTELLGLSSDKVNLYGGAVSLGHPLGSSGTRIVVTLNSVLSQEGGKIGGAAICNGGGGASAMIIRKPN